MRKESLIFLFLVIVLQCHRGHALKCYYCIDDCKDVSSRDCGPQEDQCGIREQRMDGNVVRTQKGCVTSQDCNSSSPDSSLTVRCCNTDLCNGNSSGTRDPATPLRCNKCDMFGCPFSYQVLCKPYQLCVTKSAKVLGQVRPRYDCLDASYCSTQTVDKYLESSLAVNNTCCNEDLCNLAVTLKLPSIATIGAVLLLWISQLS